MSRLAMTAVKEEQKYIQKLEHKYYNICHPSPW